MSAYVLNLLNELREKIKCEALPSILSVSLNEFNKFNNTGARMQDSIYSVSYDTKSSLKSIFISDFAQKCQDSRRLYGRQSIYITLRSNLHI